MSKFIGVKLVDAVVMTAGKAREKGYRVNQNCIDDTAGYEVTYEGGYKSWSPADVFEKYYYMIQDNDAFEIRKEDARNFISNFKYIDADKNLICVANCLNDGGFVDSVSFGNNLEANKKQLEDNIIDEVGNRLLFVLNWGKNGLADRPPLEDNDSTNCIPPHIQRMMTERDELKDKVLKLDKFIDTNPIFTTLSNNEQDDMKAQFTYMQKYLDCLERRIARVGY